MSQVKLYIGFRMTNETTHITILSFFVLLLITNITMNVQEWVWHFFVLGIHLFSQLMRKMVSKIVVIGIHLFGQMKL